MKYPAGEGQVRRFQIRLADKSRFSEVVNILASANVPTTDAGEGQKSTSQKAISQISHKVINTGPLPPRERLVDNSAAVLHYQNQINLARSNGAVQVADFASYNHSLVDAHENGLAVGTGRMNAYQPPFRTHTSHLQPFIPTSSAPEAGAVPGLNYIDHHTPRPSTAPTSELRNPSCDLPPQRELPFTVSKKKVAVNVSDTSPTPSHAAAIDEKFTAREAEFRTSLKSTTATKNQQAGLPKHVSRASGHEGDAKATSTSKFVKPSVANELDTQQLIAKAAARKEKSRAARRGKKPEATTVISSHSMPQSLTLSQKNRRQPRCLQCRSKRTKCERVSDNPHDSCKPCVDADRQCSLAMSADFSPEEKLATAEKTQLVSQLTRASQVQVRNSQEDVSSLTASQATRASMKRRGIEVCDGKERITKAIEDDIQVEIWSNGKPLAKRTQRHTSRKRSSQQTMPAPKRTKAEACQSRKMNYDSRIGITVKEPKYPEFKTNTSQPTGKSSRVLREISNPSPHLRSDASTVTGTSLDLDPDPRTPSPKRNNNAMNAGQNTSTSLRSVDTPRRDDENQCPSSPPPVKPKFRAVPIDHTNGKREVVKPVTPAIPKPATKATTTDTDPFTSINTLMDLEPAEQSTAIDRLFADHLKDDKFLDFVRVLDMKWQTHFATGML